MSVPHQRSMERVEAIFFNSFSLKTVCWRIPRESPVLTKGFSHRERGEKHSLQKCPCSWRYQREKLVPEKKILLLGFIT